MRPPLSLRLALPLLLAASIGIAISNAKEHTVNLPAWSPVIDVNDQTIQQVARFAVVAYFFKTETKLEFVNVVSGQSQPYNGGNSYRLVITAAGPGPKTARYSASVWGILGTTTWQLWSFAPN